MLLTFLGAVAPEKGGWCVERLLTGHSCWRVGPVDGIFRCLGVGVQASQRVGVDGFETGSLCGAVWLVVGDIC